MSAGTLAALGWSDELEAAFTPYVERGFIPARVVAEHRGGYYVRSELGDRLAQARGRLRDDELWGGMPAVGDWVVVCDAPGERFAIEALLPRRTKVSRKTPWLKAEEHILVANVDTVVPRRRPRRGLQPAAARALPDRGVGLRRRSRDRAHEARRLRRPGQARRGGDVAVGVPVLRGQQRHGRGDRRSCVRSSSLRRRSCCSVRPERGSRRSSNRLAGKTVMEIGGLRKRRAWPAHDASSPAARHAGWRDPDRHARTARAADLGGRHRQRVRRHRRARRAVPASTTARTRPSPTARCGRRSSPASSTRAAGRTT